MGKIRKEDVEGIEFYLQPAQKIKKLFSASEWSIILESEVYNFYLIYHLLRLRDEFIEAEDYLFVCPIRDWFNRYEVDATIEE